MTASADLPKPGPWIKSVGELFRVSPLGPIPFTLGEAVAELGLWAGTARAESWEGGGNRKSLDQDVVSTVASVGLRLRALVEDLLPMLVTSAERRTIVHASTEFAKRWRQPAAVTAAYRDLCEAAASESFGTWHLQPMADILASQLGGAHRGWSLLSDVSTMLAGEPHSFEFKHWLGREMGGELTPSLRLEIVDKILTSDELTGQVVVWLLYCRASIGLRLAAGPITFLRPSWAIPNATQVDGQEFDEREELRALLEGPLFPNEDELLSEDAAEEKYVLVRVDLGNRSVAGAREDATRRVDALLSIAVGAGGVSWINTGNAVVLVDGQHRMPSFGGARGRHREEFIDSYGINATGELLYDWARRLDAALGSRAMPDLLIEAIAAVREAAMVNHRDVSIYDERPVTPRVAIALQDHAVELVASLAQLRPEQLVSALEDDLIDHYWSQLVVSSLLAPLDENRMSATATGELGSLKYWLAPPDERGVHVLRLDRVWEARRRLQAVEVSPAVRTELHNGLAAISSTSGEVIMIERARQITQMLRSRHRRVRNAVTHGNPVTPAAISSVREFSSHIARGALDLALHAYASGDTVPSMLAAKDAARQKDRLEIAAGISRKDRIAAARTVESTSD